MRKLAVLSLVGLMVLGSVALALPIPSEQSKIIKQNTKLSPVLTPVTISVSCYYKGSPTSAVVELCGVDGSGKKWCHLKGKFSATGDVKFNVLKGNNYLIWASKGKIGDVINDDTPQATKALYNVISDVSIKLDLKPLK